MLLQEWTCLILIVIILLIGNTSFNIFYIMESPRFVAAAKGQFFKSRVILEKMARINKKPVFCDTLEGEKVIGYTESSNTFVSADFQDSSRTSDTTNDKSKIRIYNFKSGPKQFATVLTPTGSIAVTEIESKDL